MKATQLRWILLGAFAIGAIGGAVVAALNPPDTANEAQRSPSAVPVAQRSTPEGYPQLDLADEVEQGSEFDRFRQQLRQAIADRDAEFVRQILPEAGISIGSSPPRAIASLDLDNPESRFWRVLQKAIAIGCERVQTDSEAVSEPWICPNTATAFARQYPPPPSQSSGISWQQQHAIVAGENVNVRSRPSLDSRILDTVSYAILKRDPNAEPSPSQFDPIRGWTALVLPDGTSGYVYNRYVYSPLGTKALFGRLNDRWQLLRIMTQDRELRSMAQ